MGARRLLGSSAVFGGIGSTIAYTAEKITGVSEEKIKPFQDLQLRTIKKMQH